MDYIFDRKLDTMEKKSEIVRGRIIDSTITIENLVSIRLTDYFVNPEKRHLFDRYIMSDTLNFDQKKQILCSLIKSGEIKLENIYPNFVHDLQIVQDIRNIIAHTTLKTTKTEINNYDGTKLKYISFSRKFWEKEIIILLKTEDIDKEDIKKDTYSFSAHIERVNKMADVLNK